MGGLQFFIDEISKFPSLKSGGAPHKATIEYLDVAGKVLSVTTSETGFGDMGFINYYVINSRSKK